MFGFGVAHETDALLLGVERLARGGKQKKCREECSDGTGPLPPDAGFPSIDGRQTSDFGNDECRADESVQILRLFSQTG
jgi:hypothetical protein